MQSAFFVAFILSVVSWHFCHHIPLNAPYLCDCQKESSEDEEEPTDSEYYRNPWEWLKRESLSLPSAEFEPSFVDAPDTVDAPSQEPSVWDGGDLKEWIDLGK